MASDTASTRWAVKIEQRGLSLVEWQPDVMLPAEFTATVDAPDLPYVARLEMRAETREQPRCLSFELRARSDDEPVTARRLRLVPLGELVQTAVAAASRRVEHEGDRRVIRFGGGRRDISDEYALARPARRHGRRRLSDEHLREVAAVHASADERPTQTVQRHEAWAPISYSTAARWVMEARRRGFLERKTKEGDDG